MKTLTIALDDLEGADHGGSAGTYAVARVRYTRPVTLTDGTVIPSAPKEKALGSDGLASFDVLTSDDPTVIPESQGFGLLVEATIQATTGDRAKRTFRRVVKLTEAMASPIALGSLPTAEALPREWATVGEVIGDFDSRLDALESAPPAVTVTDNGNGTATLTWGA